MDEKVEDMAPLAHMEKISFPPSLHRAVAVDLMVV